MIVRSTLHGLSVIGGCGWENCEPCPPAGEVRADAYSGTMVDDQRDPDVAVQVETTAEELSVTYVDPNGKGWEVRYVGPVRR